MVVLLIILLVVPLVFDLAAWWLNLRTLKRNPSPDDRGLRADPGLAEAIDHLDRVRRYLQTQAYTRAQTYFAAAQSSITLAAVLAFWFAGGFASVASLVGRWDLHPLLTGLVYVGALLTARRIALLLPLALYQHFVLEARFGFNRYTLARFAADFLKWRVINGVVFGLSAASTLAIFHWAGEQAWLTVWAVIAVLAVLVNFVSSRLIQPWFYRFTPLPSGAPRQQIVALAQRVSYPMAGIFVIDSSRQTSKSEAICFGFGRNRRVALSDTLLNRHPPDELAAIVAHEIGHAWHHHMLKRLAAFIIFYGAMCFALSQLLQSDAVFAAFGVAQRSPYVGLVLFLLLYGAWQSVLTAPIKWLCRRAEYQADAFAAAAVGDPRIVARMLERIAGHNLVNVQPHPLSVFLHAVHPTVVDRITTLQRMSTVQSSQVS